MKIQPNELPELGYQVQDVLDHQEIVPFVRMYIKKKTRSGRLYMLANVLLFGTWVFLIVKDHMLNGGDWGTALSYSSYGITIAFLLVPVHEFIHVLAYKYVGASQTSYGANWKKFYFVAMADQFVANSREFRIVALAPFVVVTGLGLCAFIFTTDFWRFVPLATIVVHTAFCSGDFALLSYFDFYQPKEVVTYDDVAQGHSYFLVKDRND